MFLKLLIVFAVGALAVGLVARSSQGAGREHVYVVRPGDTLWSIASRTGSGDVREGVWQIEQGNHLTSATLYPGERLRVP
jgi:LysM repeat protein